MLGRPIVVLISGFLESGKDTAGNILVKKYGFRRFAFADKLKDEVSTTYGLDRQTLDTPEGKRGFVNGQTVRSLLISHGNFRRSQDINHWASLIGSEIIRGKYQRIVITDWRFPNEKVFLQHALPDFLVETWRIRRFEHSSVNDESENALNDFSFDKHIDNTGISGGLSTFRKNVSFAARSLPLKWFLVDVDEVLLEWTSAFLQSTTNAAKPPLRSPFDIDLVASFNQSNFFGNLQPLDKAVDSLWKIRESGYVLVAVSACGDGNISVQLRTRNLMEKFGDIFAEIICLPLGATKVPVISSFPTKTTIFVDDVKRHVDEAFDAGYNAILLDRFSVSWPDVTAMVASNPIDCL